MIGSFDETRREVTIIGAGIAGMVAAYALDKKGYRVTLMEKSERAGGLISTKRNEYGMAEAAAHSFLATPVVEEFCHDLGVELTEIRKTARARFILRDGKLRKFPLSIVEAARTFSRALSSRSLPDAASLNLEAWADRHLGRAALDYVLTPFVGGIYGAQPSELGVAAAFPELIVPQGSTLIGALLKKSLNGNSNGNGHNPKSKKRMVAPKEGMGALLARLSERLEQRLGDRLQLGVDVENIPDAPNLMIAAPAHGAAKLLAHASPSLSAQLLKIRYTPLLSVTAFVRRDSFTKPLEGTGVLIPQREGRKSLGILFNSSSFEGRVKDEARHASFTLMFGGSAHSEWPRRSDEEIARAVTSELEEILGIKGEPLHLVINRWPRAIPQYSVELPEIWQHARATWCSKPGRLLFGNYTGQVSLRGMIETALA